MMKPACAMLMLLLLLLAAFIAEVSAQPAPPKCCVADQFEIVADQLVGVVESGKGVSLAQTVKIAFDYTNKQIGEISTTYTALASYTYRAIIDYNKGVEYVINDKISTCQKVPLTGNMTHCISDIAKFIETFSMGNAEITANSFSYPVLEGPTSGSAFLAVSKTDCVLLTASFVGTTTGTGVMVGTQYKNYTSGIKDPSTYFTVPSYCPTTLSTKPKAYVNHRHLLFL